MTSRAATDIVMDGPTSQFCERDPGKLWSWCKARRRRESSQNREAAAISSSPVSSQPTALVNFNVSRQTPLGITVFGKGLRSWLKGSPSAGRNQQLHLSVVFHPHPQPTGEGSVETNLVMTLVSRCSHQVPFRPPFVVVGLLRPPPPPPSHSALSRTTGCGVRLCFPTQHVQVGGPLI